MSRRVRTKDQAEGRVFGAQYDDRARHYQNYVQFMVRRKRTPKPFERWSRDRKQRLASIAEAVKQIPRALAARSANKLSRTRGIQDHTGTGTAAIPHCHRDSRGAGDKQSGACIPTQ